MQNIKNILFDLGGVILNIDNRTTANAFVALGVADFSHLFGHGFAASFFSDYEIGKISNEEFIANLKKLAGLDIADDVVINSWNAMLLDFPVERIMLLNELRKKYRLFLFSNTNALHLGALQKIYTDTFKHGELDDHFEKAYYSHILGLRKPAKESYEYIIRENKLNAAETLFVDDALVNIEGANDAGLKGYFLEPGKTILDIDWGEIN